MHTRQVWLEYERQIHQLRKLRFMKSRAQAPRPFQRVVAGGVRSPLSYRLVQAVTGMISKERPVFKRLPMDKDDRERASRLQAAADPLLQDLERLAHKPLYHNYVDALVADGRAIMKCYQDAWTGFPLPINGEKDTEYNNRVAQFVMSGTSHPLRMRQVDTLNFKHPITDYEPPYVIEMGLRPTLSVCDQFGLRFSTNNKLEVMPETTGFHVLELPQGIGPTIEVAELWTPDMVYVRVGGPAGAGQVFQKENELGFIPYVWESGETSSHPDPSLASLSVLYPMAGVEPWLNTMLTVLAAWGIIGGTPIMYTSRKMAPGAQNVPDVTPNMTDIPLGKRVDLGPGGEIGFVTPPPVGREVLEFIQFLTDFLDRAGLPAMAYGSIGTRTPGTAFQGALEQALSRVEPITTAAELAQCEIVKMHWRMVERLNQPMVVTGMGIQPAVSSRKRQLGRFIVDPKDIHGYYDLHAKIKVGNTQDMIARGTHASFMRNNGLWSRDRAMEFADVEDPFEEYKDIMSDKLEESPLVQEITLENALMANPELAQRAQALASQGVDIGALLTGGVAPRGGSFPSKSSSVTPGASGLSGGGSSPAPKRGGRPKGSPKQPGGTRRAPQGSRGHA